jgi:uncharacterized membrane protein YtjA (UPF0391 family)
MLGLAIAFLIIGIIAGALGFAGIAGTATWVAQLLFFLFLIGFIITLLWGRTGTTSS